MRALRHPVPISRAEFATAPRPLDTEFIEALPVLCPYSLFEAETFPGPKRYLEMGRDQPVTRKNMIAAELVTAYSVSGWLAPLPE